jgi:hypothetical protein
MHAYCRRIQSKIVENLLEEICVIYIDEVEKDVRHGCSGADALV